MACTAATASTPDGVPVSATSSPTLTVDRSAAGGVTVSAATRGGQATPFATGLAATAVGQIFGASNGCTATVVASTSGQVALTAAHCVYVPDGNVFFPRDAWHGQKPGWAVPNEFVPGRAGDTAPNGVWPVEAAWVDPRWQRNGDPTYDIAALRLGTLAGRTPQDALGAQGITFHGAAGKPTTVLGYPAEGRFNGTTLQRCTAVAAVPVAGSGGHIMMPCDMTNGASGGPWLTDFDPATGRGMVAAITSYGSITGPTTLYARPLDDNAHRLYVAADTNQ